MGRNYGLVVRENARDANPLFGIMETLGVMIIGVQVTPQEILKIVSSSLDRIMRVKDGMTLVVAQEKDLFAKNIHN